MSFSKLCKCFSEFVSWNSNRVRRQKQILAARSEPLEMRVVPAKTPVAMGLVVVQPGINFFTTETGGSTTFTVQLSEPLILKNARKAGTLTVPISSSNSKEGTVNVTEVKFDFATSQTVKTVTVTGVNDQTIDGDKTYSIVLDKIKVKNVKNYNNKINPNDLTLVNKDDDAAEPGLVFNKTDLTVNDASTNDFTVRLSSQPTSNVEVSLSITDGVGQGTISHSHLTFTPSNWNVAQKVFVSMYLEGLHDGDIPFEIGLDTTSPDSDYDELDTEYISVTNHDIDPLEVNLPGRYSGSYTTTSFTSGFPNLPPLTGDVQFTLENGLVSVTVPGVGQGTYAGDEVTFSIDNGHLTFTGQFTENSDNTVTIRGLWVFAPISSPEATGTWTATGPLADVPGLLVSPEEDLSVGEGETLDLSFSLMSAPTADVEVTFTLSEGTGEARLSTLSLVFTPENWNVPQTLTITGVEDEIDDGDLDFVFLTGTHSTDLRYATLPRKTLTVDVQDSGVVVDNLDGLYEGSFQGSVDLSGEITPVSGPVKFVVSGDQITVTEPAEATGAISEGSGAFSPVSGPFSGAVFSGSFVANPDGSTTASGTWSIQFGLATGSGTWSATSPAPA